MNDLLLVLIIVASAFVGAIVGYQIGIDLATP